MTTTQLLAFFGGFVLGGMALAVLIFYAIFRWYNDR